MNRQWSPDKYGQAAFRPVQKRYTVKAGMYSLSVPFGTESSMFIKDSKYGYALNLANPLISSWYHIFKKENGIPIWCPLSDNERFDFEESVFRKLNIEYELIRKNGDTPNYAKEKTA